MVVVRSKEPRIRGQLYYADGVGILLARSSAGDILQPLVLARTAGPSRLTFSVSGSAAASRAGVHVGAGRLALAVGGGATDVLAPRTPSGRLTMAAMGRVTASIRRFPRGATTMAVSGRSGVPVTVRRPAGRTVLPIHTRGNTVVSSRTGASGRTPVSISSRGVRSRTFAQIPQFDSRPPLYNIHPYAIHTEKLRHSDALAWYGEMTAWVMLWSVKDHEMGLVDRCSVCYLPLGDIAETYKQVPSNKGCSNCYGTTFEGGYRAIAYRPGLWDQRQVSEEPGTKGLVTIQKARLNLPPDIELRDNDFAVRGDGTRWKVDQPNHYEIATGFAPLTDWQISVGSDCEATLLDPTQVAYTIPIDVTFLRTRVGWNPELPYPSMPPDILNGPLIVNA